MKIVKNEQEARLTDQPVCGIGQPLDFVALISEDDPMKFVEGKYDATIAMMDDQSQAQNLFRSLAEKLPKLERTEEKIDSESFVGLYEIDKNKWAVVAGDIDSDMIGSEMVVQEPSALTCVEYTTDKFWNEQPQLKQQRDQFIKSEISGQD